MPLYFTMEWLKFYIVYNEENKQKGIGFTKADAWQNAVQWCGNPVADVIKNQDSGWTCKEYTLLK